MEWAIAVSSCPLAHANSTLDIRRKSTYNNENQKDSAKTIPHTNSLSRHAVMIPMCTTSHTFLTQPHHVPREDPEEDNEHFERNILRNGSCTNQVPSISREIIYPERELGQPNRRRRESREPSKRRVWEDTSIWFPIHPAQPSFISQCQHNTIQPRRVVVNVYSTIFSRV